MVSQGRLPPGLDDGPRQPLRAGQLAVSLEDLLQARFGRVAQQVRGALAVPGVHAHVEGGLAGLARVAGETEAPRGRIELEGRDPEVEEHAIDVLDPELGQDRPQVPEGRVDIANAVAEARQPPARSLEGVRIDVEADQDAVGVGLSQDGFGVTAASEGSVDDDAAGLQVEVADALIEQDGAMGEFGGHEGGAPPAFASWETGTGRLERRVGSPREPRLRCVPPSNRTAATLWCPGDTPTSSTGGVASSSPPKTSAHSDNEPEELSSTAIWISSIRSRVSAWAESKRS